MNIYLITFIVLIPLARRYAEKILKNNIYPIGFKKYWETRLEKILFFFHLVEKLIYLLIVHDIVLHIWKSSSAVFHGYDMVTWPSRTCS